MPVPGLVSNNKKRVERKKEREKMLERKPSATLHLVRGSVYWEEYQYRSGYYHTLCHCRNMYSRRMKAAQVGVVADILERAAVQAAEF